MFITPDLCRRQRIRRGHTPFSHADTSFAIVTSHGDRYDKNKPAELSKTQTYILVREPDGQWRIAAFHNKPAAERCTRIILRE
ncbi:hypothetical protein AB0H98_26590 [Nocardia salmonicida]|uniref:hypothetical protein n=1 Tax=Nocardia salmonicida TaxID=53431 RepID=UPI0033E616B5